MRIRAVLAVAACLVLFPAAANAAPLHTAHQGTTVECDGPVLWHFIHNQVTTSDTGTLTATFANDGDIVVDATTVLPKVQHYYVMTSGGDTLLDAWDTIAEGKLVLSHTECQEGPPTS
jgi:hypothetical protein